MRALGIVFDLDGTLWDATGMAARIWNEVFETHKIDLRLTREDIRARMGSTMEEIRTMLFPEFSASRRAEIMELLGIEEVQRMHEGGDRLYDGVEDTLHALSKSYPLFIVSNCQRDYAWEFIRTHGFGGLFKDYEESGRTGLNKAENIRLVMARNGVKSAVYVGDTHGDLQAARQAGITFILARYGFGTVENPEYAINDIRELPGIVGRF